MAARSWDRGQLSRPRRFVTRPKGGIIMPTATLIRPEPPPAPGHSPFVPGVRPPEPFTLVIFGATGHLAARKLLPALYGLWRGQFLPRELVVVGVGRRDKS